MAPRANWKGYLRLSLVTCPVALFPATSESEKVSFNQINKRTGHRIKYQRVDAETGEDVENEDIVKGYKVDADTYIEVTKDELDNIALEFEPHHRHRPVRAARRDRRPLRRAPLLSRAGRQGRPRRLCGHSRHHQGDGQGCAGARGADQPRARHRARSARQGSRRSAAALPVRGTPVRPNTSTASRT